MKSIIILMLFATAYGYGQSKLEITVTNIDEAKGTIRVGLFKDDETFLKDAAFGKVVKAAKGEVKVVFENLPAGKYAASVIHDSNENEKLDSNGIGIPKEGFGFSNNAMGMFGPPGFEKASFDLDSAPKNISVKLKYM